MISNDIGIWVAAILTIIVYSFVYKDSKIFHFAEYTFVSTTIGWTLVATLKSLKDIAYIPILKGNYNIIIALFLSVLIFTQINPKWVWISRYPIAFLVGANLGVGARAQVSGNIIPQLIALINLNFKTSKDILNSLIIILFTLSTLLYFYFTKEVTKNPYTLILNKIGRYAIMITLGAGFGFTVLGRFTLMLGRLQFLLYDWLGISP
jgi:hypothetical protein